MNPSGEGAREVESLREQGKVNMYEGEGLGRLIIDLDAVLGEAVVWMGGRDDKRWSVGKALEDLYPERIEALQKRMDMMWRLMNTDGDERDD
jgi:hypothetical protein